MVPILLVPGHADPGPGHWLSLWEGSRGGRVVEVPVGTPPSRAAWMEALDDAVAASGGPPLLVGHDLGALAIVHWAAEGTREVHGALLVAPPDPEAPGGPGAWGDFAPVPRRVLPFPALVAASSSDPYLDLARARTLAADWGARFVDLGPCGHLDPASGHGEWPLGEALLQELM